MSIQFIDLPVDCQDLIFKELNFNELASISRTCTFLSARVEDFKNKYPQHFDKKLEEFNRWDEDSNQSDLDDTKGVSHFLADYDEEIENFLDGQDWPDHDLLDLDDDVRSFGSNLEYSDDDDDI